MRLSIVLAFVPAVAIAQQPSVSTTEFFIAGGPQLPNALFATGGKTFQAGVIRQRGGLGLRFSLQYSDVSRDRNEPAPWSYSQASTARSYGATFELSYDFTRTRLRPYVVGGWGLQHTSHVAWTSQNNGTPALHQATQTGLAFLGGVGFRYRVGGYSLFTETRLMMGPSGWANPILPITFGLRFDE